MDVSGEAIRDPVPDKRVIQIVESCPRVLVILDDGTLEEFKRIRVFIWPAIYEVASNVSAGLLRKGGHPEICQPLACGSGHSLPSPSVQHAISRSAASRRRRGFACACTSASCRSRTSPPSQCRHIASASSISAASA